MQKILLWVAIFQILALGLTSYLAWLVVKASNNASSAISLDEGPNPTLLFDVQTSSSLSVFSIGSNGQITLGANNRSAVLCPNLYIKGTSTLFWLVVSTSTTNGTGYTLSATSKKPSALCN